MSPDRTSIISSLKKIGETITVSGFVQTVRKHGKIVFLDLKDATGIMQVGGFSPKVVEVMTGLSSQDVVSIGGVVKNREEKYINSSSPTGTIELEALDVIIISKAEEMPFDMGGKSLNLELPTLLDYRSLTLRHPSVSAIFKIQETVASSFRNTLSKEGFTEVFVPTIVPSATEGGAEVFSVDYYGHKAYLGQSPQLYKQMMVGVFEKVFTIAHAYRAEPSVTTRHLSEYVSLDAEFGFINSYTDMMDTAETVVKDMFEAVEKINKEELNVLAVTLPSVKAAFKRLRMSEALEIVSKRKGTDRTKEPDLDPSDEKEICQYALEETGSPFVFITHFPTKKRPFYTMPDPKDENVTLSFDLLGVNEEWVTGGQRVNDYTMLIERMEQKGVDKKKFELYLQAFKYGMPPEGGFAMGLERITKDMLGLSNVRQASLFPRDMERVDERFSKSE